MSSSGSVTRRELLIVGGAVALGVGPGCAILRGGAKHPILSTAKLDGMTMRVPLGDLKGLASGAVLEVKPGKPYPDLLITPNDGGGFRVINGRCTHRGCIVDLATDARAWECPCHGSRFDLDGRVTSGPADKPLAMPPTRIDGDALIIDLSALG